MAHKSQELPHRTRESMHSMDSSALTTVRTVTRPTHGRATASTQKKQSTSQSKTSKPKADEKVMDQAVAFIQNSKNPQQAYAMSVEKYDFTPKQDNELLETVNQSVVASGKKK